MRVAVVGADEQTRQALGELHNVLVVEAGSDCDAIVNADRYLPSRQLILRELAAGKLGEPGLVRIHRWEPQSVEPVKSFILPTGLLRDLDLAMWLVGRPVQMVYAVEQTASGRFIQLHLGFVGGGMALIDYSNRLPPGDGYTSLLVISSAGAAYADDQQNMQLLFRGGRPQGLRTEERAAASALIVQEFVDAIAEGRDLGESVANWQRVLKVADAIQTSLVTRQAVLLEGCA